MQIYDKPIADASAWTRADIQADDSWQYTLRAQEIADLETALANIPNPNQPLVEITRSDFPLPVLGPRLAEIERDVRAGRGFFLLRGLPVANYNTEEVLLMKWGIGTHMGRAVSQNTYGDLLGHVFDYRGADPKALRTRGYQTNAALDLPRGPRRYDLSALPTTGTRRWP